MRCAPALFEPAHYARTMKMRGMRHTCAPRARADSRAGALSYARCRRGAMIFRLPCCYAADIARQDFAACHAASAAATRAFACLHVFMLRYIIRRLFALSLMPADDADVTPARIFAATFRFLMLMPFSSRRFSCRGAAVIDFRLRH